MKVNCVGNSRRTGGVYHKAGVSLPQGMMVAYPDIGPGYTGEMHARVAKLAQETRNVSNKI